MVINISDTDIIEEISNVPHGDETAVQRPSEMKISYQSSDTAQSGENLDHHSKSISKIHETAAPEIHSIPSQEKILTPEIKTPRLPKSKNKNLKPKNLMKKAFDNIISPVATYIHKTPLVPLIRNVTPQRPLVPCTSTPKPIQSALQPNVHRKENFELPFIAYKTAKETKIVGIQIYVFCHINKIEILDLNNL